MQTFVTIVHVFTCVFLVLLVMIQSGKGAEISASFAGSSQTVFGSSGGANFFTRLTAAAATIFMITSLTLTMMGSESKRSLFEDAPSVPAAVAPTSEDQVPSAAAPVSEKPAAEPPAQSAPEKK